MANSTILRSHVVTRLITGGALLLLLVLAAMDEVIAGLIGFGLGVLMAGELIAVAGLRLISPYGMGMAAVMILPAAVSVAAYSAVGRETLVVSTDYLVLLVVVVAVFLKIDLAVKLLMISVIACLYSIMGLLMLPQGLMWFVLTAAAVASADSFAYFGGRRFGGMKLVPSISPSKTWSGAICGIAGAAAMMVVLGGYFFKIEPWLAVLMGILVSGVSICGDLLESWCKRRWGLKDSGSILPGHGGFLDRFDGYLLALPFVYVILRAGYLDG
jgi:phosphatidate cytidylyltransferase